MSEPKSPAATEKELRDAFRKFDRDGNGTITSEEFNAIVTRPGGGKPLTIDQAARLFRRADLNGDGVVDYGEFCKSWGVIRKGGDDEKLADLQAPDAKHLMLGINLEGLREACELVGFPYHYYKDGYKVDAWAPDTYYKYDRKDHPEMSWLDEAYPCRYRWYKYLGYDFCCAVKTWLKANGHENESICQVLLKRGSKNVGRANVFYSHIQGVELKDTIKRMREGIEAHKDKLPQATEAAKALAAEQRARLSDFEALLKAANAEEHKKLDAEKHELNDAMFPDESHLFFWLGIKPLPPPIECDLSPPTLTPPPCVPWQTTPR